MGRVFPHGGPLDSRRALCYLRIVLLKTFLLETNGGAYADPAHPAAAIFLAVPEIL